MAIKLDTNMSATAYHIVDGPVVFPYAVDAQHAISRFPNEWSETPWSHADEQAARQKADLPQIELTPEEQAAIDEHKKAVAEAKARLDKFYAEQAEKQKIAEQVAVDEAIVASPPPRPDPNAPRRPFGRKGEPTPAEAKLMKERADKKAADEKLAAEKAAADKQAANPNTTFTG